MTIDGPKLCVGVVVVDKKWHKHGFGTCTRVEFIKLIPEDLLSRRLRDMEIHMVIHKLGDFLLPPDQVEAILRELREWGGRVIDGGGVELLADRRRTCDLLRWFTIHHPIALPPTFECSQPELLSFPVIRKPVSACSQKDSHSMWLYYDVGQLDGGEGWILQQFVPHSGILYKVYVVGEAVRVQLRPSLRAEEGDSNPIQFNSQHMKLNRRLAEEEHEAAWRVLDKQREEMIRTFSMTLRKELELTLFGWDLIFEEGTGRPFIIDVNYFPGFDDVGFIDLLCDELLRVS